VGELQPSGPREHVEVQIVDSYSAAERNDLTGGEKDPSQTHAYGLQWRPTEKHVFVFEAGKRVCHVGIVRQTVVVRGHPSDVAGIGGVLVRHGCRGRGYCRVAMEAAEAFVRREIRVNFVLLFCRPAMQGLYEHFGWTRVSSPVRVEQTLGNVLLPLVSMVKCLGAQEWPEGEVQLGSRPW
jgi:hypothetical protein